jgi:hypothetical protein
LVCPHVWKTIVILDVAGKIPPIHSVCERCGQRKTPKQK